MKAVRLEGNPIITTESHPTLGDNVNGPSLIRVPPWVRNPIGKYYLYFAHHTGKSIRLAAADRLEGPWRVHAPGAMPIAESRFVGHIASPDIHVDEPQKRIVMYFHGAVPPAERAPASDAELNDGFYVNQRTRVAESADGLTFAARPPILAAAYFRAWRWRGMIYALAMPGLLYRAKDWFGPFERGPMVLQDRATVEAALAAGRGMVRHSAVRLVGGAPGQRDRLEVFFTRSGDAPERVLVSTIDLLDDWHDWRASEPSEVIRPELPWEGGDCPRVASARGAIHERAWQLRDPYVFEEDGRTFLLYSIAGERGLAIAELR